MKKFFPFFLALFASTIYAGGTLTTVAEANSVNLDELTTPMEFSFTGTVLRAGAKVLVFTDGSDGTHIYPDSPTPQGIRQWDIISASGKMEVADYDKTRKFVSHKMEVVGHAEPVPPEPATAMEINSGKRDFMFVRTSGVITSLVHDEVSPDYYWMSFRGDEGKVLLAISAEAVFKSDLPSLVDAEAEITGLAAPIFGLRRRLGRSIRVYDANDIVVTKPPPEDPFSAPPLSEDGGTLHRQRISGDVIATANGRFFLRTDIGRVVGVFPMHSTTTPTPGDRVDVVGFTQYTYYWLCIVDAIVKPSGHPSRPMDESHHMQIAQLFTDANGRRSFKTQHTGRILTLRGKVIALNSDIVDISDGTNSISVAFDTVSRGLRKVPAIGSVIEATGVCWSEFHQNPESEIFPMFSRFTIYPRTGKDIRIIASDRKSTRLNSSHAR